MAFLTRFRRHRFPVIYSLIVLLTLQTAVFALPIETRPVDVRKPVTVARNIPFDENTMTMMLVRQRERRDLNHIYEFDRYPLGDRIPVILVPGRAEEFQHNSWWKGFRKVSQMDPNFDRKFKLYIYIYDSRDELDQQAGDFYHDLRLHFSSLPKHQPLMLVTYSLGGVITREALKEGDLLNQVDTIIAIAVPFHGSPLFETDWFKKYMRPLNRSPIRKFWDHFIYQTYMFNKTNLTRGLRWDNFDHSQPMFENNLIDISGDMIIPSISPYADYPRADEMKRKMIVYASYLENGYTNTHQPFNKRRLPRYVLDKSVELPRELIATVLPFYGFTVHSVFTYMNHQMSNLPTYTPENPEGKNTHLYRFNDGAIPVSSMLFLPPKEHPYTDDIYGLVGMADVRKVRIFVNLDHMHIGEYSMIKPKLVRADLLSPEEGKKRPHHWIIYDLLSRVRSQDFQTRYARVTLPE